MPPLSPVVDDGTSRLRAGRLGGLWLISRCFKRTDGAGLLRVSLRELGHDGVRSPPGFPLLCKLLAHVGDLPY